MELKCNACGATYVDVLPDGMQYFHACAPLAVHEIRAGLVDGSVQLTKQQAAQLAVLDNAPAPATAKPGDPALGDVYLSTLNVERPNKRDENVRTRKDPATGALVVEEKLAGAGVTELA